MREVEGLRARGMEVQTFSVRRPGADQLLTEVDRRAAAETPSIQPPRPGEVLRAQLAALAAAPCRYLRTLGLALRLSPGGARAGLWQLFYVLEAAVLWSWCRRRGIRHVHVHFANAASMIALLAAELGGPGWSWSFTMHGPTEFDDVTRFRLAEKVRSARFVACIGDFCRSQLMKLVEDEQWPKLTIVRCGLDPDAFSAAPPPPAGRALRVLCVGRLVPDKGQALLVEAVDELRRRGEAVELELVGDGPQRGELEALVRGRGLQDAVSLAGALGQDRMRERLAAADVFCLPSFAEGVPVVLMEAMAVERPVVTTRIMGVAELVEHGVSGLLVPPGRVDALADALAELAADPARRAAMGAAGRRRVVEAYDVGEQVERLHGLLAGAGGAACAAPVTLMGVRIDAVTEAETIAHVLGGLDAGRGGRVCTVNLDILRQCAQDVEVLALVRGADLVVADGMPLIWASRLAGQRLPERIAGSTLISGLSAAAADAGRSVFLLGGNPGTAQRAAARLRARSPALRIPGTWCPPFGFEHDARERAAIDAALAGAQPDIVFVGLSFLKQDRLMVELRAILPQTWFVPCGIGFSFLSGEVHRAPPMVQHLGLEWLHRLFQEPRRLAGRYLVQAPPFVPRVVLDALRQRQERAPS